MYMQTTRRNAINPTLINAIQHTNDNQIIGFRNELNGLGSKLYVLKET